MYRAIQKQLIIWTSILVVGLGAVVALVCLQPPAQSEALFMSRAYARLHHPLNTRRPAAEQPAPGVIAATSDRDDARHIQALDVTLDCDSKNTKPEVHFENEANQLRISGKLCQPGEEILSSEIRNEANNTTATVFFPTVASYTTDYIALAIGENRIRILNILKSGGREERELKIDRARAGTTASPSVH